MEVRILLPDLYRLMKGQRKKQMAWVYLQKYYPECSPLPSQDELDNNILVCKIDFDKARKQSKELSERMAARKAKPTKKKK